MHPFRDQTVHSQTIVEGSAPQLTLTKGLFTRELKLCIERATNSFPVPLSPSIKTVT